MVKAQFYEHRGASAVLQRKGLLTEIHDVVSRIPSLGSGTHDMVSGLLGAKKWQLKARLLPGTGYTQDAFKEGVMVEIDLRGSLLDSVHRNFLRAQELFNRRTVEALVQITETERDPKFSNMKRDIEAFSSVLTVPIYLVGLSG